MTNPTPADVERLLAEAEALSSMIHMGEKIAWGRDTAMIDALIAALRALPAVTAEAHPDDAAVDRFAAAMKEKLAKARAKGRGGWDDPEQCSVELLASLLIGHIGKGNAGNFEDIANLAMMLHQRGADPSILAAPTLPDDVAKVVEEAGKVMEALAIRRMQDNEMPNQYVRRMEVDRIVASDTIRALTDIITAQAAQIAGLKRERKAANTSAVEHARASQFAAETALAAERAKTAKLVEAGKFLAWMQKSGHPVAEAKEAWAKLSAALSEAEARGE